jgi:hypothetical protein
MQQQQQLWPAAASKLRLSRSSNTLVTDAAAQEAADTNGDAAAGCRGSLCKTNSNKNNVDEERQAADAAEASHVQPSQQHLKNRMLWARALTKSKAVVRLLHAGQQHSSSGCSQQPHQVAGVPVDS